MINNFDKKTNQSEENSQKAIKEAFENVKKDIFTLGSEVSELRKDFIELKSLVKYLDDSINDLKLQQVDLAPKTTSTHNSYSSTHPVTSTHTSTVPSEIQGLNYPNLDISSGNGGASTDRQTIRQTDNSTHFTQDSVPKSVDQHINDASEMLENLDSLKKEIRLKFKHMTTQEMLVFSTIYQLEEQGDVDVDYKKIALKLGLSQSSIRDYVQRIANKGIPIHKTKLNNKKITISISPELKKIASLNTILALREI